jgi:hypothetical protein
MRDGNIFGQVSVKEDSPKGMHRRTYERLGAGYDDWTTPAVVAAFKHFGLLRDIS